MTTNRKAPLVVDPETVFARLMTLSDRTERQLELALAKLGFEPSHLPMLAKAAGALTVEQRETVERRIADQLPEPDARWAQVTRPDPAAFSARGLQMLRI